MTRIVRIVPLVALLVVLTGCPAGPAAFTMTVAVTPAPPPTLPPGGQFTNVVWTGYLIRTRSDGTTGEAWTQKIFLSSTSLYPGLADFSYSDARVDDILVISVTADYFFPNLSDPAHPTVYHVQGIKSWPIKDAWNAGVPQLDSIQVAP
jgi:hypothetical protein